MILAVGDKVIYPCRGPCLIGTVVQKVVDGKPISFYHLVVLDDNGGELFVPVEKAQTIGLRLLLERSEIPKLLGQLEKTTGTAKDWKQRAIDNSKLLTSGSAFDLAEVVKSLTELSETKALSYGEHRTLERARRLLVCEVSEVMGEAKSTVEEQVNKALKARKAEREISLISGRGSRIRSERS